jgi:hypothetical protein
MRSICTLDFSYVRNYEAGRWPQGNYPSSIDLDALVCKNDYVKNWQNPVYRNFMELLQKQPAAVLYDLRSDPHELKNVAGQAEYAAIKAELSSKMTAWLKSIGDPRMSGEGWRFDTFEYFPNGRIRNSTGHRKSAVRRDSDAVFFFSKGWT